MKTLAKQPQADGQSEGTKVAKAKKKRIPVAEQYSNLQDMCRTVLEHLKRKGIEVPETVIQTVGEGLPDSKTGAMVINALAPVAFLLTRFSGMEHWFQRRTFHHTKDPIYQRLIVAILKGYYVPPLRVAAVANKGVVTNPSKAEDWTLIDGLQRTTCYIIAVLMAALGEEMVDADALDEKIWDEVFKHHAEACSAQELLQRQQQMEVFYNIGHAGVLHFMLLLNSAQRQMNAKIQLELMNIPLIKLLQNEGIQLAKEQEKAADNRLEKSMFKGSNLIVAVQGYMQKNPQVMTGGEKEAFLSEEREYLEDPVEDMGEVIEVLKIITGPLQKAVTEKLGSTILSEGEVFTTALMAACGRYADPEMTSFDQLMSALKRLVADIQNGKDPLDLETYWNSYRGMTAGKGRKIRSIICSSFLEYFRGDCKVLQWEQNSRIYE
jgi:hypothetical protein